MAQIMRDYHVPTAHQHDDKAEHGMNIVARAIYIVGGIITGLLALRFLLTLLGANSGNAFANFIYDTSRPFAQPFFGLFNYDPDIGRARIELETLFAIAFYGLVTWLLVRLVTIGSHRDEEI